MMQPPTVPKTDPSPLPTSGRLTEARQEAPVIRAIKDLVGHARARDLALADEVLTDVLARLNGWPVEELNRFR